MKKKKEFFNNNSNFGCVFSFIVYLILLLILMGISIIFINRAPEKLVRWSFFLIIAFVIFYSDNSRIRTSIVKRLPRNFPFYKQLKIVRGRSDEISELYKTIIYYCLLCCWNISYLDFLTSGAAIVFTILSLYRYFKYNEKVHFGQPTDNRFSPTSMCLLIPGVLFSLWALENHKYNLLFWILLTTIFLILIILFFIFSKEGRTKFLVFIGYSFCILIWIFGSLNIINITFDFQKPQQYPVIIQDKETRSGYRSVYYYVIVSPWDEQTEDIRFDVSPQDYRSTDIGDTVTIYQSDGALGMEWYELHINND